MKRYSLLQLLLVFGFFAFSQDTIIIRNIKQYKEGKVNILRTPSGKTTVVTIQNNSSWKEKEETDSVLYWDQEKRKLKPSVDTSSPLPNPLAAMLWISSFSSATPQLLKSYVDPNLTTTQKTAIKANECKNAKFAGLSRSKVKTSISNGSSYIYNSLSSFINTLPPDVDMEITIDELDEPWKNRAIQELKNVTLKNVYLKAYKREKDNDYHLIVTNSSQTIFFNVEISGLPGPSAASYQKLKAVRTTFDAFPGAVGCQSNYIKFDTPIKIVKLKGSIFFDTDHAAGSVGPTGFRPETAWEIHPVTLIVFE